MARILSSSSSKKLKICFKIGSLTASWNSVHVSPALSSSTGSAVGISAAVRWSSCRVWLVCGSRMRKFPSLSGFVTAPPAEAGGAVRNPDSDGNRSEENTSDLQSPDHSLCGPWLEQKRIDVPLGI